MIASKTSNRDFCGVDLTTELTKTDIDDNGDFKYTTYGIIVKNIKNEIIFQKKDISTNKNVVLEFIDICERNLVAAVHLMDVLEDFLP